MEELQILYCIMFWIAVVTLIVVTKTKKKNIKTSNIDEKVNTDNTITPEKQEEIDYSNKYQRRYLLSKNEYSEWKKLKYIAEENNLIVCVKVRLLDLIEPRSGNGYMSSLGKIQSKHVDFVICDQNLGVKAILELDDNSHNQENRKQRDLFVDQALTETGYKVIRTRSITENTLDCILESNQQ